MNDGWAGYVGDGSQHHLRATLGPGCVIDSGSGYALGARPGDASTAPLHFDECGGTTATIGHPETGGCTAMMRPGATATLESDPFGLHGVFTAQPAGALWFASDPRFLRQPASSSGLDAAALHGYLCFSYVPTPLSIFEGIQSLPAGDRMTVSFELHSDANALNRADHPSSADWRERARFEGTHDEAVDQLRGLLTTIIRARLGAETQVGVFLSGGLDSSLIAALLVEAGADVHLFSLDFGPPYNTDLPYARRVAEHLGKPLRILQVKPGDIESALIPTARALQHPFGDGVTAPLWLLGRLARDEVGIIFNGEGGDQLFGGWANKPMIAAELHADEGYDRLNTYMETYHRFYGLEDQAYTPEARASVAEIDARNWVRPFVEGQGFQTLLHRLRAANLWLKGAQNIAPRASQLAAAHGLRMEAPFFDRALAEWTFSLPPEWFLQGACEKFILKRVAESLLPPDVVWRDKQGMGVPTAQWCLDPLSRTVGRWLDSRQLKRNGWLSPGYVEQLRRGEDQPAEYRHRRVGERLWALLMLHVWCEVQDPPLRWPTG